MGLYINCWKLQPCLNSYLSSYQKGKAIFRTQETQLLSYTVCLQSFYLVEISQCFAWNSLARDLTQSTKPKK